MELYRKTINFGPNPDELKLYHDAMKRIEKHGFNRLIKQLLRNWLETPPR